MKLCKRCNTKKYEFGFYDCKRSLDGKRSYCKECCLAITMSWRKRMISNGNCITCGKSAVNKRHCDEHRVYEDKYQKERYKKSEALNNLNKK